MSSFVLEFLRVPTGPLRLEEKIKEKNKENVFFYLFLVILEFGESVEEKVNLKLKMESTLLPTFSLKKMPVPTMK
jgi:hypothetical protein